MPYTTERLEIWKRIPAGECKQPEVYCASLAHSETEPDALALLRHQSFSFLPPEGLGLVRTTVSFLGFACPVQLIDLIEVGEKYGLFPCPTEVAAYLAWQDEEAGDERLAIIMRHLWSWNHTPQTIDVVYTMRGAKLETRGNHKGVVFYPFETVIFAKKE